MRTEHVGVTTGNLLFPERREVRFYSGQETTSHQEVRELVYPTPWVTTIYFGKEKGNPFDTKHDDYAHLRMRFYSDREVTPDSFFLDVQTPGVLELKIRPIGEPKDSPHKIKQRLEGVSLSEVIASLQSKEAITRLGEKTHNPEFAAILQTMYEDDELSIGPIAASQYKRRHFVVGGDVRVTVDTNVNFYLLNYISNEADVVAKRADSFEGSIVEVKSLFGEEEDSQDMLTAVFGQDHQLQEVPGNISKRDRIKEIVNEGFVPQLTYPDINKICSNEQEKVFTNIEREFKIDLNRDPRPLIMSLPQRLSEEITLGDVLERTSYQQFITYDGKQTVAVMRRSPNFDAKATYKGKITLSTENGILVRDERFAPTEEKMLEVLGMSGYTTRSESPSFVRDRKKRFILDGKTGLMFVMMADHCVAEDTRKPLDQIEVEFVGNLQFSHKEEPVDEQMVEEAFFRIKGLVMDQLQQQHITYTQPGVTKASWIA